MLHGVYTFSSIKKILHFPCSASHILFLYVQPDRFHVFRDLQQNFLKKVFWGWTMFDSTVWVCNDLTYVSFKRSKVAMPVAAVWEVKFLTSVLISWVLCIMEGDVLEIVCALCYRFLGVKSNLLWQIGLCIILASILDANIIITVCSSSGKETV